MPRVFLGFAITFAIALGAARLIWGGGNDYRFTVGTPTVDASVITNHLSFNQPPSSISIDPAGAVYFTVQPEARSAANQLLRIEDGIAVPFPDANAQQTVFDTVSAVTVGATGQVFVLDHGNHGIGTPTLFRFNAGTGEQTGRFDLSDVAPLGSHLTALVTTADDRYVLIADAGTWRQESALVVVDARTGNIRRELAGEPSISAGNWYVDPGTGPLKYFAGTFTWRPGLFSLAIDRQQDYLYLAALANDGLYRMPLAVLLRGQSDAADAIERFADKPLSSAMLVLPDDQLLITDVINHALHLIDRERRLRTLVQTSHIRWAAGLALTQAGDLLISDAAFDTYVFDGAPETERNAPFFILKVAGLNQLIAAVE